MEVDLRVALNILRNKIWLIIAFMFISCIALWTYNYFFTNDLYEASTKLIVNKPSETAAGIEQLDMNAVNTNILLISTYKEVIKSNVIMEETAAKYPELHLNGKQLEDKLMVSAVNGTQIMTIKVRDQNYERAARIVNAVAGVFKSQVHMIFKVDNITILHDARAAELPEPVNMSIWLKEAVMLIVSFIVVTALIFIREMFDDTIKNEFDVETELGLVTLAVIPQIKQARTRRDRLKTDRYEAYTPSM